jgi:pyridoxal phosphate enzyme (YggS family)
MDPADEIESFRAAHGAVLERIRAAWARADRDPRDVSLVAVSKTVPAERIRAAVAAGLTLLGENRVQEGVAKRPLVPGAAWHLIGPLQSNKARAAVDAFDVIETIDSAALAARVGRIAAELGRAPYPVFVQVNVDEDPSKAGLLPGDAEDALSAIADVPGLRLLGLMTIGRLGGTPREARATFVRLRSLAVRLRAAEARLGPGLSMGMSDDYEVAIEEGATHVRVGRALFGERT